MNTTPLGATQLLQELAGVRNLFAAPHEALIQQRSDEYRAGSRLDEEASTWSLYQDALAVVQPAVHGLGRRMADGSLDALRASAQRMEAATAGDPLAQMAAVTLQNLSRLAKTQQDANWSGLAMLHLAAALGDAPEHRSEALDEALGRELVLSPEVRQLVHPEPFMAGEFTPERVESLSESLKQANQAATQHVDQLRQDVEAANRRSEAANDRLQGHWQQHRDRVLLQQRLAATKLFVTHLAQAEEAQPGTLRTMQSLAPEQIGLAGRFFPNNVLASYQSQMRRAGGDEAKVDWMKLMGQIERTSLS